MVILYMKSTAQNDSKQDPQDPIKRERDPKLYTKVAFFNQLTQQFKPTFQFWL